MSVDEIAFMHSRISSYSSCLHDCSPPSCLSLSEVEVVFRKLRGGSYYNLYCVKAHNNNLYNDYADFYAKQAVYDGEVFSVPAPRSFLSSSLNKFILESWTSSWNDCNTGLRVKRFFNNPKLNILPISKYLVHFLTNHGPFPAYLHRFNLLPLSKLPVWVAWRRRPLRIPLPLHF
ncbi:RNase H domain-containing protein [Trichonephila clavipes]|nr:RNase H domain-containing protein [Trichonephila clavipes]